MRGGRGRGAQLEEGSLSQVELVHQCLRQEVQIQALVQEGLACLEDLNWAVVIVEGAVEGVPIVTDGGSLGEKGGC